MGLRKGDAVVAVIVALFVALAGCSPSGRPQQKAEQEARNDAQTTAIHDELAKVPGVVKVQVDYSNSITAPGSAQVTLTVTSSTDLERVAVGAVWRSQLDPLESIGVGVVDANARTGIERGYNIFDHQTELEAKYGPRPAEPR